MINHYRCSVCKSEAVECGETPGYAGTTSGAAGEVIPFTGKRLITQCVIAKCGKVDVQWKRQPAS